MKKYKNLQYINVLKLFLLLNEILCSLKNRPFKSQSKIMSIISDQFLSLFFALYRVTALKYPCIAINILWALPTIDGQDTFAKPPIASPTVIGVTLHAESEFSRAINSRIERVRRELGRYRGVYGKQQHLPRLAVWVPRGRYIGRPDKSNVCTLVRCTMETPRERSHLSLQAGPSIIRAGCSQSTMWRPLWHR